MPKRTDVVNQPEHYLRNGFECIDAQMATSDPEVFSEHCRLVALKYIWRANYKGKREEDLRKAIWYLNMAIGEDPRREIL